MVRYTSKQCLLFAFLSVRPYLYPHMPSFFCCFYKWASAWNIKMLSAFPKNFRVAFCFYNPTNFHKPVCFWKFYSCFLSVYNFICYNSRAGLSQTDTEGGSKHQEENGFLSCCPRRKMIIIR